MRNKDNERNIHELDKVDLVRYKLVNLVIKDKEDIVWMLL
jgi:hypothetical protein